MSSSKILRNGKTGRHAVSPFNLKDVDESTEKKIELARQKAEGILKKARIEKESIEMDAYNKGLEQGQEQGQKIAVKRLEPLFEALEKTLDGLETIRGDFLLKNEDQILRIIFMIAQKVIHREVSIAPDIIIDTVRAASQHLMETDEIKVKLHPSDYEYVREIEGILSKKLSGRKTVNFVEDSSIERGGVVINTEFGDIDARITSQIELIKESLFEDNE